MASFAPPRFQLARKASVNLSPFIYHAVKINVLNDKLFLASSGDESEVYGFLINNPVADMFGEVATFGGGAKGVLAGVAAPGDPLKISPGNSGQLEVAATTETAIARAWEAGIAGDIIEIEPVLFTVP